MASLIKSMGGLSSVFNRTQDLPMFSFWPVAL